MGTARGRGGRPELRELRTPPCGGRRGQRWGRTEGAGLAHPCTTPGHNRSRSVTRSRMRRASPVTGISCTGQVCGSLTIPGACSLV